MTLGDAAKDLVEPRPRCERCGDRLVRVNGVWRHEQLIRHPGHTIGRLRQLGPHQPVLRRVRR